MAPCTLPPCQDEMGALQSMCKKRKNRRPIIDEEVHNGEPSSPVHDSDPGPRPNIAPEYEQQSPKFPPLPDLPSTSIASPKDKLCSTCEALGLTVESFIVRPRDQEPAGATTLGQVQYIQSNKDCPFCRLVIESLGGSDVPAFDDGKPVSVMFRWSTSGTSLDPAQPANVDHRIRNILTYAAAPGSRRNVRPKDLYTNPKITLLANDSPTESKVSFPRLIKEDGIDLDLVRTWIAMCEVHHGSACNKSEFFAYESENPAEQIPSFRLIDVIDNHIVHAPKNPRYLALSYVWGRVEVLKTTKSNILALEKPGSLLLPEYRQKIPQTIWEAMQVTKELNFRYLWVDSLCIIQDDDTGSKAEAIEKMDLVYSSCFLTIIATGAHANAGIEGLFSNPRGYHQIVEEIGPNFRLVVDSPTYNFMQDSVYSTRAWTFQERQFTPRNLTFVGGQVSYSCGRANWREDAVDNPTMLSRTAPAVSADLGSFSGTVQSYSKLSLSFDSDIHNAFAGLGRYFKANLNANLVYGIPDKYFDWCLLWVPHAHQERREGAPSWSWTGWKGQSWNRFGTSSFSREPDKVSEGLKQRTWIIWYHRIAHDSTECIRIWDSPDENNSETNAPHSPRNFYGGEVKQRFSMDCTETLPTPMMLTNAPNYYRDIQNIGSGFLQFWTVSVDFNLGTPTSKPPRMGFESRLPHARVGVFGRDGYEVTVLYIDQKWASVPEHVQGKHQFILLCEGREERPQTGEVEEDGWRYMIMLIEYRGQNTWAERVALGSIAKKELSQALGMGPVWKEITLG